MDPISKMDPNKVRVVGAVTSGTTPHGRSLHIRRIHFGELVMKDMCRNVVASTRKRPGAGRNPDLISKL